MKIAIPNENGAIAQHMGECPNFTIVDTNTDGTYTTSSVTLQHLGNAPIMKMLADEDADAIICGQLGLMTRSALEMLDIKIVPGCKGGIDDAVNHFMNGEQQGDNSILNVEIAMDADDPLQCMRNCAMCGGCNDMSHMMVEGIKTNLPKV